MCAYMKRTLGADLSSRPDSATESRDPGLARGSHAGGHGQARATRARVLLQAGIDLAILPRQGGLSDANRIVKAGVPITDGLGPLGGGAHTPGEYVVARSVYDKTLTLIYFLLARPELAKRAVSVTVPAGVPS